MRLTKVRRMSTCAVAVVVAAGTAVCLTQPTSAATLGGVASTAFTKLNAVSAASTTDAWAVGFRQDEPGAHSLGLTEHWDGTRWRTVPSAHPGDYSYVWGVADLSPTDAWAVGETLGGAMILPFAEHWDGSTWQIVPLNAPGIGKLNAVAAGGADDVWMVGTGYDGARQLPRSFIAHWDGSRIHRVRPAALSKGKSNELTAVAAVAGDDVWAVGEHGRDGQTYRPLIEHYDGTSWTVAPGDPKVGSTANLAGVDGTSATDVWAVGWNVPSAGETTAALAEHWDGKQWTISTPVMPGYASNLTSVSMVSANDVWAVGTWAKSQTDQRSLPLIEHWDGRSWSIIDPPASGPHARISVESISMDSADDGFAVGDASGGSGARPYIIRWDGTTWSR